MLVFKAKFTFIHIFQFASKKNIFHVLIEYNLKKREKSEILLVKLFNDTSRISNIRNKNISQPRIKIICPNDVFEKKNQINFMGNPKIMLFEDMIKLIKNGDLDAIIKLPDPHVINTELKSLLHISAEEKQFEISKNLLAKGLDLNQKSKMGKTPFAIACQQQDEPTFNLFLGFKPNINVQDNLGDTPLHLAIPNQNILGSLLKKGANPYIKNNFGLPVLHEAAENLDALEYLLKYGVNPNSINDEEQTLLHIASADGNTRLIDKLISFRPELNFRDKAGKTPLFYANNKDTLSYLLEKDAKTDIQDNKGRTALHEFVIKNELPCVSELLSFFANPNITDKYNKTPILYASNNKIRQILLESGADPNIKTSNDSTLLHLAVQKNNLEVIKTLLRHKANPNILDKNQKSPLAYATSNEVRRRLLENGADPDENLYLHWALKTDNKEFFDDLLTVKINVNIEDANGRTPIFYCKDEESIIKLIKKNADILHEDKSGNTPLHYYSLIGNTKIVGLLADLGDDLAKTNKNGETPSDLFAKYKQYDCWIK